MPKRLKRPDIGDKIWVMSEQEIISVHGNLDNVPYDIAEDMKRFFNTEQTVTTVGDALGYGGWKCRLECGFTWHHSILRVKKMKKKDIETAIYLDRIGA